MLNFRSAGALHVPFGADDFDARVNAVRKRLVRELVQHHTADVGGFTRAVDGLVGGDVRQIAITAAEHLRWINGLRLGCRDLRVHRFLRCLHAPHNSK